MRKRISAIAVGVLLLINFSGCANSGDKNLSNLKATDIELWTTYSAQKVLQKDASTATGDVVSLDDLYGSIKKSPKVSVTAAKNEYEFAQLIITPSKNVSYYDVKVNNLNAPSGEVFSKSNIEVYNQKYIQTFNQSNTPKGSYEGWYPDALLPFAAAKRYSENTVKAGENQGLVFDFFVPADTVAGTYSGSLEIDFKNFKMQVPIELSVIDYTVSEVTHSRSIFLHDWFLERGELDSTQDMMDLYTEALSKYRLSPFKLIPEPDWRLTANDIPLFVEKAYEYAKQDKNSTFCIAYRQTTDPVTNLATIDKELFKDTLRQLVEKSLEKDYNILSKAACYFTLIDEPAHQPNVELFIRFSKGKDYATDNEFTVGFFYISVVDGQTKLSTIAPGYSFTGINSNIQHYGNLNITGDLISVGISGGSLTDTGGYITNPFRVTGFLDLLETWFNRGKNVRDVDDYSAGYADGLEHTNAFLNFFPKVFGAVGSFFVDTLGGITLFGISLWQIVITCFGLLLILLVMKFIT